MQVKFHYDMNAVGARYTRRLSGVYEDPERVRHGSTNRFVDTGYAVLNDNADDTLISLIQYAPTGVEWPTEYWLWIEHRRSYANDRTIQLVATTLEEATNEATALIALGAFE